MADRSSLDLLLEINQTERQAQLSHFDSLDAKAGLVLGFAGVLIAVGAEPATFVESMSVVAAALAAATAFASFWPRRFPSIDPHRLGQYAVAELGFTQLTLLDTLELMLVETGSLLQLKSRRLKWVLVSLLTASGCAALGLVLT